MLDVLLHDTHAALGWTPAMQLVAVAWLSVLGAVIGSFLNVVVYRLPRGINLSFPGSHSPACQHAIRWHDNLPVLGWLKLGGRCRDCGARIAPRYPLVEAVTAVTFALLAWADLFSFSTGQELVAAPSAWAAWALHAGLASTLLCAALIKYDGQRVASRLFAPAILLAVCVSFLWPEAFRLPLDWFPGIHLYPAKATEARGWPECLAGMAAGFTVGSVLTVLLRSTQADRVLGNVYAEMATCGCCLGWQATAWLSALVILAQWPAARGVRAASGVFFIGVLLWALLVGPMMLRLRQSEMESAIAPTESVPHTIGN